MTKNTKRRVTTLAAALFAAALLAGCSDGNSGDRVPGDGNATDRPAETESATAASTPDGAGSEEATPGPVEGGEKLDGEASGPAPADEPYTVVAEGLDIPWAIAFDGGDVYISEREGAVVKLAGGEQTRQSVRLAKAVHHEAEGGFMGFLLAPDFEDSRQAYAYHTYREGGRTLNRIALLKLEGAEWVEQKALLEGIPGSLYHNGGRLAFGPDGQLYATTGDATETSLSQNKSSLAGKILRLTPDGSVPSDNPVSGSYVYSYGHRNPQGIAWTSDGSMYSTEHGPSGRPGGHDEINLIKPGANYGWPDIIGDAQQAGMETPLYHTGDPAIAPSGTIVDGEGRLLVAALVGEAIYRYTPATGEMEVWHKGEGRIRDLHLKDGKLYFVTNNRDGRGNPLDADDRLIAMDYK